MSTGNLVFENNEVQLNLQTLNTKSKRKKKRFRLSTSDNNPFLVEFDEQQQQISIQQIIQGKKYKHIGIQRKQFANKLNLEQYIKQYYSYSKCKNSPTKLTHEKLVFKKLANIQLSQQQDHDNKNLSVQINCSQIAKQEICDNQIQSQYIEQFVNVPQLQIEVREQAYNFQQQNNHQYEASNSSQQLNNVKTEEKQQNKYHFIVDPQDRHLTNKFIEENIARNNIDSIVQFLKSPNPQNFFMEFLIKRIKSPFGTQLEFWAKNTQLLVCKSSPINWIRKKFQIFVTLGIQQHLLFTIQKQQQDPDFIVYNNSEQIIETVSIRYSAYGTKKKQIYTVSESKGRFYQIYKNTISKSLRVLSELEQIKNKIRVARSRQIDIENIKKIQQKYNLLSSKKNIFLFEGKSPTLLFGKKEQNKYRLFSQGYRSIGQLFAFVVVHLHT